MEHFKSRWLDYSIVAKTPKKPTDKSDKSPESEGAEPFVTFVSASPSPYGENQWAQSLIESTGSSFTEDAVEDLFRQAEALMTLYGVLIVDCGDYLLLLHHCDPTRLVEARLIYAWGIIGTTGKRVLMKWGEVPESAWEEWSL